MRFTAFTCCLSVLMAAQAGAPFTVSALSREELQVKYAEQIAAWNGDLTGTTLPCDPADLPGMVNTDESGIGRDGRSYGEEFADTTVYPYGEYLFLAENESCRITHLIGSYETEGNYYYILRPDGTACIIGVNRPALSAENIQTLRIPDHLGDYPVTEIGSAAFMNLKLEVPTVTKIVIPESVTVIHGHAFFRAFFQESGCSINVPEHIIYLGQLSFGCLFDALGDTVTLPETLEYADYCTFGSSTYLKELNLPEVPVVCYSGNLEYGHGAGGDQTPQRKFFADYVTCDLFLQIQESTKGQRLEDSIFKGDVNADGTVDVKDAVLLAQYVGNDEGSDIAAANADLNSDGAVNTDDLTALMRFIAHLD